ncbi:tail fiber assembly protein [Citrobacter braakii]|uniref:tail fiber assembly protein n=1 Tax=Citrobacter braakii TaxID=57706 RepID=UPI0023B274BB|nr:MULTISPECIES: tail fiber assembly protein [Citrobacter freundii complex]MDE9659566.1 tail fiber assembly protein [Citrobacter braakii]MDN4291516.1 tail fiber assembly protein [Citrobacter freundii]MEC3928742.1 tail fiber assembly protein [Citrobacter braakii]
MKYVWSASNNAFFETNLFDRFISAGWSLNDAIDVSDDIFNEYTNPPEGKVRIVKAGYPAWADIPPLSNEELSAAADVKKADLRVRADSEINWRQDAIDAGLATIEETVALTEWKKYRVLLMRVDCSKAPDISWPEPPKD